jgi:type I restriction enzyme, S subunit
MELTDAPAPPETLDGWRETTVEELKAPSANALATGPFGSSIGSRFFRRRGVPIIRGSNLRADGRTHLADREGLVFLTPDKAKEFRRSIVRRGDLIFTCWGTVNQVGLVGPDAKYPEYVISNKQMKFTPDSGKVDSLFLFYLFSGPELQQTMLVQSIGSSVPGFNLGQLRSMRLRIPPLGEQRRIADALKGVDDLAHRLDQLLTKKRSVMRAVMQMLLTGEQRLEGWHDEWEARRLGDVATALKGRGLSKTGLTSTGASRCVLYGELFTTYGRVITKVVSRTDEAGGLRSHVGDVLVPGSTTTTGIDLATASALLEPNVLLGGDINVIRGRGRGFDPIFLAYYLSERQRRAIADRAQGITIVHLYGRDLLNLDIVVPTVQEQAAIGRVLMTFQNEIAALELERGKVAALKRAMMQSLLSGQVRLLKEVHSP